VVGTAVLAAATGCSTPPAATISYHLVGLPTTLAGVCPAGGPDGAPALPATKVRLTFRTPGGPLRCDLVLPLGGGSFPIIDVPDRSQPVDLYAEYFDDAGNMVGRGQEQGIDLAAGGDVWVPVAPAGRFACTYGREVRARAFHTATLLPTGDVLLVGGLGPPDGTPNAAPFDPTGGLFVTASAELYHPDSRTFTPIVIPGLAPRAMHAAYVFDNGDGLIHVALIGGISATGDPTTTPVLVPGTVARWIPTAAAVGAAGEIIDYDPAAGRFSRSDLPMGLDVPPRVLGALPDGIAAIGPAPYAGGLDAARAPLVSFDLFGGAAPAGGALRRPRVGATVTPLDGSRALVWGGDVGADSSMLIGETGELIAGLPDAPAAQQIMPSGAGGQRAFHAAARTGAGLVVIAGGFKLDMGSALAPAAAAGVELTISDATVTGAVVDGPAGGWPAAATIGGGDVVATGGNPAVDGTTCADAAGGVTCALAGAWRFPSAGGPSTPLGPMQVARYGHRLTPLADGTVLVTGGLGPSTAIAGDLEALADAELLEPRTAADDPIADLAPAVTRMPGDVARDAGGTAIAVCPIIAP